MKNLFRFIYILLGSMIPMLLSGQSVTSTAGSFYKTETAMLSWTLGECVVDLYQTDEIILNQGFQQFIPILNAGILSGYPEKEFRIYPNPASDRIQIKPSGPTDEDPIRIELIDICGRLRLELHSSSDNISLDVSRLPDGLYCIRITGSRGTAYLQTRVLVIHNR